MTRRVRHAVTAAVLAAVVTSSLGVVVNLATEWKDNVWAWLAVGVLTAVNAAVSLYVAWSSGEQAKESRAVRALLQKVIMAEERALQQLLGDTGIPRPADVGFTQPEAATVQWRTDGGAEDGSLGTIAAYYRTLTQGRLVVLGEAGGGKTVLALRLLLDLARDAHTTLDNDPGARVRVPVRLSLSAFTLPDGLTDIAAVRARLDAWIAKQLVTVHGVKTAVATALVADGWILPVLDGLDEMDPEHDLPKRARQVLAALNHPAGPAGWAVVLTCRTKRYEQLTRPDSTGTGGPLQDATPIVAQPLGVEQVITWLAHRFPDPTQPDQLDPRWRRVASTLRKHPGGRLAGCLRSPLHLYLAAAVYRHPDTTPRDLCGLNPSRLHQHLLDNLIPALTRHHPRPDGTHYDPTRVHRWITTLANHLADMTARGHSGTDIHLHHLWRSTGDPPGRRILHRANIFANGLLMLPLLGLVILLRTGVVSPPGPLVQMGLVMLGFGVVGILFAKGSPDLGSQPKMDLRNVRMPAGRRKLMVWLLLGLVVGLGAGFALGLIGSQQAMAQPGGSTHPFPVWQVAGGLLIGLAVGFAGGLTGSQQAVARPSEPMRQHMTWHIVGGVAVGLGVALAIAITFGLAGGIATGIAFGLTGGLTVCLAIGLLRLEWPCYVLTVRSLHRTDHFPTRPGCFLDWAYTAGLVRLAGNATQFRHRDLQTHFTTAKLTS